MSHAATDCNRVWLGYRFCLKTNRSSFENLRASPELDDGTNGRAVEIIGDFPFY